MKNIFGIVVTYNGMQWIEKCLNSLVHSTVPLHIIVVDNGSQDGTIAFIKEKYPAVKLVETGSNLGFGQANNVGFNLAIAGNAQYVFLLNQDAWIDHDTIEKLVDASEQNPGFGIISPLHFDGEGADYDRYFFEYLIKSDAHLYISAQKRGQLAPGKLIDTPFVNAAAWLITMKCLQRTGGFDPVFFHYGEDQNYAQRALYWGFKIGVHPSAKIYHDRAERIARPTTDSASILKKDWMNLLVHACNIQRKGYLMLMLKRGVRYGLQGRWSMTRKIVSSLSRIRKSRLVTSRAGTMPYLRTGRTE